MSISRMTRCPNRFCLFFDQEAKAKCVAREAGVSAEELVRCPARKAFDTVARKIYHMELTETGYFREYYREWRTKNAVKLRDYHRNWYNKNRKKPKKEDA